jgi:hypothetical protein
MNTEATPSGSSVRHWIRLVVGAAMFYSPWLYKFTGMTGASTSAWVAGAALMALGAAGFRFTHPAMAWGQLAIGAWLLFAPWIIKFSGHALATQAHVICGALMLGMAVRSVWAERRPQAA